jgi:DNA-binding transcriptional LysR family regulator
MYVGHLRAPVDHDHAVSIAPFDCGPPDACDREQLFAVKRVPSAGHSPFLALGLAPCAHWDEAPPLSEAVAPERGTELVLARVVHWLGLERLAGLLALKRERKAPGHRLQGARFTVYLWPTLKKLLPDYPDISVEIVNDYALADIVTDRFDAGVRLGEQVAKDMIAVRIAPDMPMAVVGSPAYFAERPVPIVPQDLVQHRCINLRLPTSGGLYVWGFENDGHELKVRTEGPLVFNTTELTLDAALEGFGLGYLPKDQVGSHVSGGRLISVLADWTPALPGYHLYYPSRRHPAPAFALLVDALRYRP